MYSAHSKTNNIRVFKFESWIRISISNSMQWHSVRKGFLKSIFVKKYPIQYITCTEWLKQQSFVYFKQKLHLKGIMSTKILPGLMWETETKYKLISKQLKNESKLIKVDSCAIRVKERFFGAMKTVGHIRREISRHVYFFIKREAGSVKYHPRRDHP